MPEKCNAIQMHKYTSAYRNIVRRNPRILPIVIHFGPAIIVAKRVIAEAAEFTIGNGAAARAIVSSCQGKYHISRPMAEWMASELLMNLEERDNSTLWT